MGILVSHFVGLGLRRGRQQRLIVRVWSGSSSVCPKVAAFLGGLVRVLSLLEAEEEEPTLDLSSLITTHQQELLSESIFNEEEEVEKTKKKKQDGHGQRRRRRMDEEKERSVKICERRELVFFFFFFFFFYDYKSIPSSFPKSTPNRFSTIFPIFKEQNYFLLSYKKIPHDSLNFFYIN